MEDLVFHWSGGKDSAMALYQILADGEFKPIRLLTNFSKSTSRVSMHGVRPQLIEAQAKALSIPLEKFVHSGIDYEELIIRKLKELKQEEISYIGYGDIFLEDLKAYRDGQLSQCQLTGVYPLWKKDTNEIVNTFIEKGFKAVVVCVDGRLLDRSFVGRELNDSFLRDLPDGVDPCGENGEFHTFVYDGPIFKYPIPVNVGEVVRKGYPDPKNPSKEVDFCFCDLVDY